MEIYSIGQSLPGHPDCGAIQIIYSIPPGTQVRLPHSHEAGGGAKAGPLNVVPVLQGPEHPNPGQPFTCRGFPRFCFLPDNHKGRKVSSSVSSLAS